MPLVAQAIKFLILFAANIFLVPLQWLGFARASVVQYWLIQRLNGVIAVEASINNGFSEAVHGLVRPFRGPLVDIGKDLRGLENSVNEIADIGMVMATALDGVKIKNPSVSGFQVKELGAATDAIQSIINFIDQILNLLGGGLIHGVFSLPAALLGYLSVFFLALANMNIMEVASGFVGGIILLVLVTTLIPMYLFTMSSLLLQAFAYLLYSLFQAITWPIFATYNRLPIGGTKKNKKPPKPRKPKTPLIERIVPRIIERSIPLLVAIVSMGIFLTYPFMNLLAIAMLAAIGAFFVMFGEFYDKAAFYAFGIVALLVGSFGFFLEFGIGIVATSLLVLATMVLAVFGLGRLEKWSETAVTEPA